MNKLFVSWPGGVGAPSEILTGGARKGRKGKGSRKTRKGSRKTHKGRKATRKH